MSTGLDAPVERSVRRQRLHRLADERGIVAGIALDHRDSLRAVLVRSGLDDLSLDALQELKLRLVRAFAPVATAVMLDDELGGLALDRRAILPGVGLIMPLENQGDDGGDDPTATLMRDFTAASAVERGADAGKLLVAYRADRPAPAKRQDAVIRAAAADCHRAGMPLVVEPLVRRLSTESTGDYAAAYPRLVVEAARRIRALGVDLLKLPFPVLDLRASDEAQARIACGQLAEACDDTPWVLLGGGSDTAVFLDQVRLAGAAGASGFLVGRGIWASALDRDPDVVERRAERLARDEFALCREAAVRFARPLGALA